MSVQTTKITTTRKRQSMGAQPVMVTRTPAGSVSSRMSMGGGGTTTIRRSNVLSSSMGPMIGSGEAEKVSRQAVENVKGMRGKEKKDMCDLNGRLAELLENVKFLKTTNTALYKQLEELRKVKGITGDRVREEYEDELQEARNALKESQQQLTPLQTGKIEAEDKVETLENELERLKAERDKIYRDLEKVNQLCGEFEGENSALKRNIELANNERDSVKRELQAIRDDNRRIREDCEAARNRQIDAEHERDMLTEELEFLRDVSEKEIQELRELLESLKNMNPQMESMYKTGIKEMMAELQAHYDNEMTEMKTDLQRRYEDQLHNIQQSQRRDNTDSSITKTENKQLKIDNKDLKDRLKELEPELHSIQANQRRDETDGLVKQENKSLKSQVSDSKRNIESMSAELERLKRELDRLRREREEENADHENEVADLKEEIARLTTELQCVRDNLELLNMSKVDLELEIACYRKLLDGEESKMRQSIEDGANMQTRGAAQLSSIITGGGSGGSSSQSSNPEKPQSKPSEPKDQPPKNKKPALSQSTGRIQVKRSSKCGVTICEVDQGGRYIMLQNGTKKDFDLNGWSLSRTAPRGKVSKYSFGRFTLGPEKKVMILSYNNGEDAEEEESKNKYAVLVAAQKDCRMWGSGNGDVNLIDTDGKVKADSTITYMPEH